MRKIVATSVAATALALSACGGGGGGDGNGGPNITLSDVNFSTAISITGGSPSNVSRAEAKSERAEILYGANLSHHIGITAFSGSYGTLNDPSNYEIDYTPETSAVGVVDPIMTKNGVHVYYSRALGQYPGTTDRYDNPSYGGWMNYSEFSMDVSLEFYGDDEMDVFASGRAWGDAPHTNPGVGPLAWYGVMAGRISDLESAAIGNVVQGDAAVSAELPGDDMTIDITFTNIRDLITGGRHAEITWTDLPVVDGAFRDHDITGSFFGPRHEEVAGAFAKDHVLGAFGARRE